jgi:putative two-component system response regulator
VSDLPLLIVDDEAPLRQALARMLERRGHRCILAEDVAAATRVLETEVVALVLCDIDMPGGSGLGLLDQIASRWPDVAVVMVTGLDDTEVAERAIASGAYGYVVKPFDRHEILVNVANALRRRSLEVENRLHRENLELLVASRTAELELSQAEIVQRLAAAAELRDPETASHLERMSRYSALIGGLAGMDERGCEVLRLAAPMHDIGKIGISDEVLFKTGVFDDADRAIMATHTEIGRRILEGSPSRLIQVGAIVAQSHHEWWDGSGYPNGLRGEAIPIEGRIVAIADVFDALTTARRYKPAYSIDEAIEQMASERGRHFDPNLLDLFLGARDEVMAIRAQYVDSDDIEPLRAEA